MRLFAAASAAREVERLERWGVCVLLGACGGAVVGAATGGTSRAG